jgi:hypothetical protein
MAEALPVLGVDGLGLELLQSAGEGAAVEAQARQAAAHAPQDPVALHNLGLILLHRHRPGEAEQWFRRALALSPDTPETRCALGNALLRQGRYGEAWPFYLARHRIPAARRRLPTAFPFPQWQGEPLAGKRVAIFPEQGFGDQILSARFVPRLMTHGAEVILFTHPALLRLFRNAFPEAQVIAATGAVSFPDPDYWMMMLDLPGAAGATLESLPSASYLVADALPGRAGDELRIGVKMRGNPDYQFDHLRTPPAEQSAALQARLPGTVVSLEPEESGALDFADTAALMTTLDLIVSTDTSVSHLAGGLGLPCFTLVSRAIIDWRWGDTGERTPWYPNHRLFRASPDDWEGTIDTLVSAVESAFAERVAPAGSKA